MIEDESIVIKSGRELNRNFLQELGDGNIAPSLQITDGYLLNRKRLIIKIIKTLLVEIAVKIFLYYSSEKIVNIR